MLTQSIIAGWLVLTPAPEAPPAVAEPVAAPVAAEAETAIPALSDAELEAQRGGEGIVVTSQSLTAITSGNVINGDFTAGSVSLTDNALQNFNGLGNLLINTGAQVNLQAGMNVTINIDD